MSFWMERFLVNLVPVKGLRRRLRREVEIRSGEYGQKMYGEAVRKFLGLGQVAENVRHLVLGSSHAHYGYLAGEDEFNLAEISCDLYYCHEMLTHWLPRLPSLDRVILFVDIFSAGSCIERSSEVFRRIPWLHLYGMKPQQEDHRSDTGIGLSYDVCEKAYVRFRERGFASVANDPNYRGNALKRPTMRVDDPNRRVASHVRLSRGDRLVWLERMISACAARGVAVVVVYPPLRADFRARMKISLDEAYAPVNGLLTAAGRKARVLDLSADGRFEDADFVDMDHLSLAGAGKLTRILTDDLEGFEGHVAYEG